MNPATKIEPKDKKWLTILVKTGVYKEEQGQDTNGADYVVTDLQAAFDIVLQSIEEIKKKKSLELKNLST